MLDGAVPGSPVPCARLDELESGNGAELDPVAEMGMPDVGKAVPLRAPVPVGPNETVEELLNGKGTLAVLLREPPGPVPVGPENVPDGPVSHNGDVFVGPTPEVELEAGNGAAESVVEGDGAPVREVTPVPGALPDGPDIPVELPAENGGPVCEIVPDMELLPVPIPVTDTVPLVNGKGVGEDSADVSVKDPVPGGMGVTDSIPDVSDRSEVTDPVLDVEPTVPGAVPDPNPGAVVLPAGNGVEGDDAVSDGRLVSPGADVVKEVPISDADVAFPETGAVVSKVSVLPVELLCLVTVML